MPLRSLFVDFNSYFASVEQEDTPRLRGRPVAVTPVIAPTGCCIAASVEAK
ncbi:MAG: DNA polymerase IV, partial [Rhodanobacteraceae bacterium]